MRRILAPLCALILALGLFAAIPLLLSPAAAATGDDPAPCVPKDAYIEIIERPADMGVEIIEHPAVTCPEEPPPPPPVLDCDDAEYVPVGDECEIEEPPVEEPPVEEPGDCKGRPVIGGPCAPGDNPDTVCQTEPEKCDDTPAPAAGQPQSACVGDALVTKRVDGNGNTVATDTVSGHPSCAVGTEDGPAVPVTEEGF